MKTTSNYSVFKSPLLSYRNIGGQKTTSIFESFQKSHKLVEFHSSKGKKERLPLSEADALLVLFSFYFISRISSSFTSSVGLPPASSLFRKASITLVSNRRSLVHSSKPGLFYTARTWPHLSSRPTRRGRPPRLAVGWSSSDQPIPSDQRPSAVL